MEQLITAIRFELLSACFTRDEPSDTPYQYALLSQVKFEKEKAKGRNNEADIGALRLAAGKGGGGGAPQVIAAALARRLKECEGDGGYTHHS